MRLLTEYCASAFLLLLEHRTDPIPTENSSNFKVQQSCDYISDRIRAVKPVPRNITIRYDRSSRIKLSSSSLYTVSAASAYPYSQISASVGLSIKCAFNLRSLLFFALASDMPRFQDILPCMKSINRRLVGAVKYRRKIIPPSFSLPPMPDRNA